jgi:hypothetical protein
MDYWRIGVLETDCFTSLAIGRIIREILGLIVIKIPGFARSETMKQTVSFTQNLQKSQGNGENNDYKTIKSCFLKRHQ